MPQSLRVLTRFSALVLVGGLILGVCFAALTPGAREIALSHKYTATVKSLGQLSESTTVYDAQNNVIDFANLNHKRKVIRGRTAVNQTLKIISIIQFNRARFCLTVLICSRMVSASGASGNNAR